MTQFTSASAHKYLKKLEDEKSFILKREAQSSTYRLAVGEEAEPPVYDYAATRDKVDELDAKVLKLRHAIHSFNAVTVLPKAGMTIDEALIAMAQLNGKLFRLATLKDTPPKERAGAGYGFGRTMGYDSRTVEYVYANYDHAPVEADYEAVGDQITAIQLELDLVNQTKTFEIDL